MRHAAYFCFARFFVADSGNEPDGAGGRHRNDYKCGNGERHPAPDPSWTYLNPDLPVDQRVDDLIGRMTVDEKISQLMMSSPAIPRLGVLEFRWWSEALHGVARRGTATVFSQAIALAATWNPDLHHAIAQAIATEVWAKNNQHDPQTPAERAKANQFNHLSLSFRGDSFTAPSPSPPCLHR